MDLETIRAKLAEKTKQRKRREVAKATGLPYSYLRQIEEGLIKNPGSSQMDIMRNYFIAEEILAQRVGRESAAAPERRP